MRVVLDTSVLIAGDFDLGSTYEYGVSSLSYAELAFGASLPGLAPEVRADRQARLLRLKATFGPGWPFDDRAAASYGILTELVIRKGQQVRRRALDLLIAAVAHSLGAGLVTSNGADVAALATVLPILTADGRPYRADA